MTDLHKVLPEFELNEGATLGRIREVQTQLAVQFPSDYEDFLLQANGGEGPVGRESYLILWPVEELVEHNEGHRPDDQFAPDLTFIGTDGGNEVFAIRQGDGHFVAAPLIGMSPEVVRNRGVTLREFLTSFP